MPVGLSLAAVGTIVPLGNIVDPAVGGNKRVMDGEKIQFFAPGEQICALQYFKVSYRWLYSKRVENLKLSKWPRWTASKDWRTAWFLISENPANKILAFVNICSVNIKILAII